GDRSLRSWRARYPRGLKVPVRVSPAPGSSRVDPGEALEARYRRVRARTEALIAQLSAEDCALQSVPDASPAKWHLAHTTWFFETFVVAAADGLYRSPRPRLPGIVQLVLPRGRCAASASRAPAAVAAFARRSPRLPHARRRRHAASVAARGRGRSATRPDRGRAASRRAAPGAHPDRRPPSFVPQSAASRLRAIDGPRGTRG